MLQQVCLLRVRTEGFEGFPGARFYKNLQTATPVRIEGFSRGLELSWHFLELAALALYQ